MKNDYRNFIGIYYDVYPDGFCEHLISEFERNLDLGAGFSRQDSEGAKKHVKEDQHIFVNGKNFNFLDFNEKNTVDVFFQGLQKCYEDYSNEFSVLSDTDINCNTMKMQKTSSGGGYHIWHGEQGNGEQGRRCLVYSLYLNTLPEGANGETEFLYQQRRVSAVKNSMVFWPAAFTHAHRGNPVYGDNAKYIVTGWFYYE